MSIGIIANRLIIADSWWRRWRGLSGKWPTPDIDGMIFYFPWPARWRFSTRRMQHPIDILWIRRGRIIAIDRHVGRCHALLRPPALVDTVIELWSGRLAGDLRSEIPIYVADNG